MLLVVDSAEIVSSIRKSIPVVEPDAQIVYQWDVAPDQRSIELVAGAQALEIEVAMEDSLVTITNPMIRLDIPSDRFALDTASVECSVILESGIPASRRVLSTARQSNNRIVISLDGELAGPWSIRTRLGGTMLWKNDSTFVAKVGMEAFPCISKIDAQPIDIKTVACGSRLREVSFVAMPRVRIRPLLHPFTELASIEIESSTVLPVSLTVQTLSGQQFVEFERLTLQKGVQHCNFSCSDWMKGVYILVIRYGAEVLDRKVIIVN